jgi:alginate O-acetyltransferase complex protein AlgJ
MEGFSVMGKKKVNSLMQFIRKAYSVMLIGIFLAVLMLPLASLNFDPRAFETSFFGRLRLVRLVTDIRVAIGDRVFSNALIGRDGWLFQTSEDVIRDYQNDIPLTEKQLASLQQNLDGIAAYFETQGAALLIVVAPSKSSIYPDYMPAEIQKLRPMSRFDQVVAYLQTYGKTRLLDLRQVLIDARKDGQVYYQTDTHWTEYGAYLAYREILNTLHASRPQLAPRPFSDFEPVSEGKVSLDLAELIGSIHIKEEKVVLKPRSEPSYSMHNLRLDDGRWITLSWNQNISLPRAVVFYDSFFYPLIPWLNDHFSQATYIPHFANLSTWNLSWVSQQKADVVIVEIAEKYIHDLGTLFNPEKVSGMIQ